MLMVVAGVLRLGVLAGVGLGVRTGVRVGVRPGVCPDRVIGDGV